MELASILDRFPDLNIKNLSFLTIRIMAMVGFLLVTWESVETLAFLVEH